MCVREREGRERGERDMWGDREVGDGATAKSNVLFNCRQLNDIHHPKSIHSLPAANATVVGIGNRQRLVVPRWEQTQV